MSFALSAADAVIGLKDNLETVPEEVSMRKIMIILAITAMTAAYAQADGFMFNGFGWGTPKTEIIADTESSPSLQQESPKRATFAAIGPYTPSATGVYLFTKDNLLGGAGYIWHPNASPTDMLQQYDLIKADLTLRYGEPYGDRAMWNSNRIKALANDNPVKGLELGGYCLNTAWETEDTTITLTMMSSAFHDVPESPVNLATVSIELIYYGKAQRHNLEVIPIF